MFLFLIGSVIAQELPNLENQILKFDDSRIPNVYFWERKNDPVVHGTMIIRLSDEQYVSYGSRLPLLLSDLWNLSIPLQNLSDLVGKKYIQSYDSLNVEYLKGTQQNETSKQLLRNEYSALQAVLKFKVDAVIANQSVGRKIQFQPAMSIGQSIFIRFQFEPNALDKTVNYIYEKLHNPFWLMHIEMYGKISEGYPISEKPVLPLRLENSIGELWNYYLSESEVSIAFVGNLNASEARTICDLYWSNWNVTDKNIKKSKVSNFVSQSTNQFIIPNQNRELIRHWIAQIGSFTYQEKCAILTNSVPYLTVTEDKYSLNINQHEIYKRWITFITECLIQPDLAADILSISNLGNGWESWYEIDEKMKNFMETSDYFWIISQLDALSRR